MSFDISQYKLPEVNDETLEILLKVAGAVDLYLPSLIGCYLGFKVSSDHALRYFIAAQNVPAPKAGLEAPKIKNQLLRLVLMTWFGGFLVHSVGYLGGPFAWWSILILPFTWISTLAYLNASNKVPMSVHRNKNGEPILASGAKSPWSRFFVILSLYVTIYGLRGANGANLGGKSMLSLISFAGMIYIYASGGYPTKKMNLFGLLMSQFIAPMCFIPTAYFSITDVKWREALGEFFDQLIASQAGSSFLRAMLLPIFFASTGQLLAMLLRFDYATFTAKHPEVLEANPLTIEAAPLASLKPLTSKAVEDGVKLPNKLPFKFSKKYYRSAFFTWILTITSLMVASVFIFPGMNEFETIFVAYYVSLVTSTSAPLFVAVVTGEFRMLWKYSEDWKLAPVPAVVDPAQDLVDALEEKKEEELLVQV